MDSRDPVKPFQVGPGMAKFNRSVARGNYFLASCAFVLFFVPLLIGLAVIVWLLLR